MKLNIDIIEFKNDNGLLRNVNLCDMELDPCDTYFNFKIYQQEMLVLY